MLGISGVQLSFSPQLPESPSFLAFAVPAFLPSELGYWVEWEGERYHSETQTMLDLWKLFF